MSSPYMARDGVKIGAPIPPGCNEILTPEAVTFVADLHRKFDSQRKALLNRRIQLQATIDAGQLPDFLPETAEIRKSNYVVAAIPQDLLDRRVEITGPVDRKMVINALNSGANVFMADFEDSNSPTWENNLTGQINVRDAVRGDIEYTSLEGKQYKLNAKPAVLIVRPRGWHLTEKHFQVDEQPISGSLFDFGLYFFDNVSTAVERRIRACATGARRSPRDHPRDSAD
jgi:malate synthase